MTEPKDILEYWIGPPDLNPAGWQQKQKLWYAFDPATDEVIRGRFGADLTAAEQGDRAYWLESIQGQLALIVLFDQFSRNLYRGTAGAYKNDAKAVAIADEIVRTDQLQPLNVPAHILVFHAYLHAEDPDRQALAIALAENLIERSPAEWRTLINGNLRYMKNHSQVIEQFGRFPHRNKLLGRTSTPDELAYLAKDSRSFGQ